MASRLLPAGLLPADPTAPAMARRMVSQACADLRLPFLEDALLLVSEVVTNAVRYGTPPLTLLVARHGDRLLVEVGDANPQFPAGVEDVDPDAEGGRGLYLIAATAKAWGHRPQRDRRGKTVWFEL